MKKLLVLLAISLLAFSIVYAADLFTREVPIHIVIDPYVPQANLEVFSDPAATVPVTFIDFNRITAGQTTQAMDIYLKNTGEVDFTNITFGVDFPVLHVIPSSTNFPLLKGEVYQVSIALQADTSAVGTYDGILSIHAD